MDIDQNQLKALADAAPCHLLFLDLDERIIFANQVMLEQWKLNSEQVTGRLIKDIIGDDASQILHGYTQDVLSGQSVEYVSPFFIEGELRYFRNTYTPYKANGRIIGFIATGLDITEKVTLESQLKSIAQS